MGIIQLQKEELFFYLDTKTIYLDTKTSNNF